MATRGTDGPTSSRGATPGVASARLRPPVAATSLLRRRRLLDLLDEVASGPLTLLVAAAGSGKTSLLASWAAEHPGPLAWLTLDEGDHDPARLWTGVVAALETLAPGCGRRALARLGSRGGPDAASTVLLDDLDGHGHEPAVLIVEDLHLVDVGGDVDEGFCRWLTRLPAWVHVVVSSRRTPGLPVDRLRAQGRLAELGFEELRFTDAEAAELLARLAPGLTPAQVSDGVRTSAGWAAALRLVALAARRGRAGSEADTADPGTLLITDYVWHEVLAGEREELVQVLQAVSVVDRVTPDLAVALTGRDDAEELLLVAERRGLFVGRSTTGAQTVHPLVRSILAAALARRSPELLHEQHVRAAGWYEAHDEVARALEHWLRGGEPRSALRLLAASNAALYDSGAGDAVARTLDRIPARVATEDLWAMSEYVWCHLLVDRHRFLDLVGQATRWAEDTDDPDAVLVARLEMLQSVADAITGDWTRGAVRARRSLERLGPAWPRDPLGRFGWNMIARDIALTESWDDGDRSVRELAQALSVDPERHLALEGTRALGEALAGRPADALRVAAGVRKAAEVTNLAILRTELALAEAIAYRELGDRARSVERLVGLLEHPSQPTPYAELLALVELAGLQLDQGDLPAARREFDRAVDLVRTDLRGTGAQDLLARTGVTLELAAGDPEEAGRWAGAISDAYWSGLSAARLLLAAGDAAGAATRLQELEPRCVRHAVLRDLLLARATESHEEAMKHVIWAVELASAHGLVQTVASEGERTLRLVELAAWRAPQHWLDRLRRSAAPDPGPATREAPELVEALTDRERQVLRLLPSRLTLGEVAEELHISVNTLKFHLKVVYRKLGCGSRAEAAEIARAMTRPHRAPQPSRTLRR